VPRVRVIGCGTPDAGDDAVGIVAAGRVRDRVRADVEVLTAPTALHVLDLIEGADEVILVDAVRTADGGRAPGSLVREVAGPDGLSVALRSSLSSHGLGLGEAVGLASALGGRARVVFLGLEVADVRAGRGLSDAVAEALPALVDAIVEASRDPGGAS
jgi:hydrogenase maturation protease